MSGSFLACAIVLLIISVLQIATTSIAIQAFRDYSNLQQRMDSQYKFMITMLVIACLGVITSCVMIYFSTKIV